MLAEFFTKNLDVVYFFYGLAFFAMGVAIFTQSRIVRSGSAFKISEIIWIFGGFGVIRGLVQWFYMIITMKRYSPNSVDLIYAVGLTLSYIFIFEFGRKLVLLTFKRFLNIWSTIILTAVAIIFIFLFKGEPTIWPRYLLGAPGGIMTALGFVFYYRDNENTLESFGICRYFLMVAVWIGIWGVLSGAIPPKGDFFPPSAINETSFLNLIGIPVHVFRSCCAIMIAWSIWNILSVFERELEARIRDSERLAGMGKMASVIGHEFRNQLSVMGTSIYFLKMKLQEANEKVKRHLLILEQTVMDTNRVIENILTFSKTKQMERKSLNLENLLLASIENIRNTNESEIVTHFDKALPKIHGDRIQLTRLFVNIISNAFQAMEGKGKLIIEAGRFNDSVNILFKDTGVGIKDEDKKRLFEPFFSTRSDGVGLGLHISKNIVEAHGGSINIEGEIGKGTIVTVRLPIGG